MTQKKRKSFSDLKKNSDLKIKLIEDLKNIISADTTIAQKEKKFNVIRKEWVAIGKVPGHLVSSLNNSYYHQIKIYYDLVYLDSDYKERDLEKNLNEKRDLIEKLKIISEFGNKIKSYKDSLKIIRKWNFLTGPTRQNYEQILNEEFDQLVKKIKDSKKDYLNNKGKYIKFNVENKKSLLMKMELIIDQECSVKTAWMKKINSFEIYKKKFVNIGPINHDENNELWNKFKKINKKFLQQKNSFFKNLKKEYSDNINKQNEIIKNLEVIHRKDEPTLRTELQELKKRFNSVENVPYKKNRQNRKVFFNLLNECYEKIGDLVAKKKNIEKKNSEKIEGIINEIKKNFSKQNIDDEIQKLSDINVSIPIRQLNELSNFLSKKFRDVGHNQSDIESNILKIKSSLMSDEEKNLTKMKIKKRIDDIKKQIGQLENNLTFVKSENDNISIFDNVHNQIEKFNEDLILQKKKLSHFI